MPVYVGFGLSTTPEYYLIVLLVRSSSSSSSFCFVRKTAVIFVVWFCPCNISYLLRVVFFRATAVIFFVFRPCNRYLFLFSTYGVRLAPLPFRSSCITFFRTSAFFFFPLFFLMVRLVLVCSRTRHASISLALP